MGHHEFRLTVFTVITMVTFLGMVRGHGYMLEPPSRQSAARLGYPSAPWNPDDNQLYCGGKQHQWDVNGGKCGVCGDPWDETPRSYEHPDGRYVKGVDPVNKVYAAGQTVEVIIRLTQSHLGYFVFRLCDRDRLDAPDATEDCLQQNVLRLESGGVRYRLPRNCNGLYKVKVTLPADLTCEHCFLQWKYHSGNDYGCFQNGGPCCTGCGERQEEFYACADIVIRDDVPVTSPVPGVRATCSLSADNGTMTSGSWPTTTSATTTTTTTPSTTTTTTTTSTPKTTTMMRTTTTTTTTPPTTPTTTTTTTPPTTTTTTSTTTPTTTTTTPTTKTTTAEKKAELEMRCRGQGSSCAVYCTPGLYVLCEAIPHCAGCKDYFNGAQ